MDFKSRPYSEWLDKRVVEMYGEDPKSIAMVYINKNDEIGTCYFGTDHTDTLRMIDAMNADRALSWLEANSKLINDLLKSGEDDG